MNVNNLTIGQAKEIVAMFGGQSDSGGDLYSRYIGKYVIVRSRNEGVNAGRVIACDNTGIILADARRLQRHRPLKNEEVSWYEGVALTGLNTEWTRVSAPVEKLIVEDYSITVCTAEAEKSIREFTSYSGVSR